MSSARCGLLSLAALLMTPALFAAETKPAPDVMALAINHLGLDLCRLETQGGEGNLVLSPYSIESALAMIYAGASGETRDEMQRVLRLPPEEGAVPAGFRRLADALKKSVEESRRNAESLRKYGMNKQPLEITTANRLFVQTGFSYRTQFVQTLKDYFGAALQELDFANDAAGARRDMNQWMAKETGNRILHMAPPGALDVTTRLVLANAILVRSSLSTEFQRKDTKPEPFAIRGRDSADVPTMFQEYKFGYTKEDGYAVVSLSLHGGLQFLIFLPDSPRGLKQIVQLLTPEVLENCRNLPLRKVLLHLPKFRIQSPSSPIGSILQDMGMKTAFDSPPGSAELEGVAPRQPNDHLKLNELFHTAWLDVNETGIEAAGGAIIRSLGIEKPDEPVEVKVDHPFFFAIQHIPTGTCLFLGRVTDPR